MNDTSGRDHNQRSAPRDALLYAEALQLCRLAHQRPRDAVLTQRIERWRAQSTAHEASWQLAYRHWNLSAGITPNRPGLAGRLWYACDLGLQRLLHTVRQLAPHSAVPALCLLLVLAVVLPPLLRPTRPADPPALVEAPAMPATAPVQEYNSTARERRVLQLADGSQLTLNWNTAVQVELGDAQRAVTLLRGEALFDVAPDAERPFIVHSGSVSARAVGTVFSVRHSAAAARVMVSEGRVAVSSGSTEPALLQAGQQIDAGEGSLGAIQMTDAAGQLAWTEGMLVFNQHPLGEVLDELGRYTSYRLARGTLRNADSPVTATYFIERSDDALALVANAFDLRLQQNPDGSVLVEDAPPRRPY